MTIRDRRSFGGALPSNLWRAGEYEKALADFENALKENFGGTIGNMHSAIEDAKKALKKGG